jgi:hypothetical protein
MKKITLLLLSFIFTNLVLSQNNEKKRLSQDDLNKLKKINEEVANKIGFVQAFLNSNWRSIKRNEDDLLETNISNLQEMILGLSESKQKKINEIVCIECLIQENNEQKQIVLDEKIKRNRLKDSLEIQKTKNFEIEKANLKAKQEIVEKRNDSIRKSKVSIINENPYDVFSRSLTAFSKNQNFTVFRNIDYNFAYSRLTFFMQQDLSLSEKKPTFSETKIIHRYIPKVSNGNEFINVEFIGKKHKGLIGYYPFLDELFIIDKVNIRGTSNLIIEFFLKYWETQIKLSEIKNKTGIVATKSILSDYINLKVVNSNLLEIERTSLAVSTPAN